MKLAEFVNIQYGNTYMKLLEIGQNSEINAPNNVISIKLFVLINFATEIELENNCLRNE